MSMIGNYRRLTEGELNALLANPETIAEFLYSDEGQADMDKQLGMACNSLSFKRNCMGW
jgi:hypothetical protein